QGLARPRATGQAGSGGRALGSLLATWIGRGAGAGSGAATPPARALRGGSPATGSSQALARPAGSGTATAAAVAGGLARPAPRGQAPGAATGRSAPGAPLAGQALGTARVSALARARPTGTGGSAGT